MLEPGSVEIWIYYLWRAMLSRSTRGGSMAEVVIAKHGLEDVDNTISDDWGGGLSIMWRIYLM